MDTHFPAVTTLELVLATNSEQLTEQIANFKRQQGIRKLIAFCGGSAAAGPAQEAVLTDIFAHLRPFAPSVAILTGGTCGGLPEAATRLAHRHGLGVLAVVPACAKPENLLAEVACRIRVEALIDVSTWGSEAAVLLNLADAVVLLGGGAGTLIELANALKINEGRLRTRAAVLAPTPLRSPIVLAPVTGQGGVADLMPTLLANGIINRPLWDACLPAVPLHSGQEAAAYLLRALAFPDPAE
jgi:predicted Rossmann-fold nucleotide-binding protein